MVSFTWLVLTLKDLYLSWFLEQSRLMLICITRTLCQQNLFLSYSLNLPLTVLNVSQLYKTGEITKRSLVIGSKVNFIL